MFPIRASNRGEIQVLEQSWDNKSVGDEFIVGLFWRGVKTWLALVRRLGSNRDERLSASSGRKDQKWRKFQAGPSRKKILDERPNSRKKEESYREARL